MISSRLKKEKDKKTKAFFGTSYSIILQKRQLKTDMAANAWKLSTQEAETGEPRTQGRPGSHSETLSQNKTIVGLSMVVV